MTDTTPRRVPLPSPGMYGTYERLDLHASASNRDVIRAAAGIMARTSRCDPGKREARRRFYRVMLACHAYWRQMVRDMG